MSQKIYSVIFPAVCLTAAVLLSACVAETDLKKNGAVPSDVPAKTEVKAETKAETPQKIVLPPPQETVKEFIPMRERIARFIDKEANPVKNSSNADKRRIWYLLGRRFFHDFPCNPCAGREFADDAEESAIRAEEDLMWTVDALRESDFEMPDFLRLTEYLMNAANRDLHDGKLVSAYAELILNRKDIPVRNRVFAYGILFDAALNVPDVSAAEEVVKRMETDIRPDTLDGSVYADAHHLRARLFCVRGDCDGAVAYLRSKMTEEHKDKAMYRYLAEVYRVFHRTENEAAVFRECGDKCEYLKTIGDRYPERGQKIAMRYLRNPEENEDVRRYALEYAFMSGSPKDAAIRAKYPEILKKISGNKFREVCRFAISCADYPLLREMIALWKTSSPKPDYERAEMELQMYAAMGDKSELSFFADEVLKIKEFTDDQRLTLHFCARTVMQFNSADAFRGMYEGYPFDANLSRQKRADLLLKAASLAMNACMYPVAYEAYLTWKKLYLPEQKKLMHVPFCDNQIIGPEGFLRYAKQAPVEYLDRKFGGNMDFLVTDVSTGTRTDNIDTEKNAQYRPTKFCAACDENGVHFLFTAFDDKVREIEAGSVSCGSFEAYLAPGDNQPYFCFLPDMKNNVNDVWESAYNTPQWRRISGKQNKIPIRAERVYTDNGYMLYMFLSWETFFDKLPEKGVLWDFENIHWSRFGGYSWNGTKSIHGRSTWGNLTFDISPNQMIKIKRKIIYAARQAYLEEKETNGNKHGVLDRWSGDNVLGDPDFYREKVKPLVNKLDSYLNEVSPDMSPETVEKIYQEAVPGWMNISFIVSDLRRQYLEQSFMSEGK